MAPPTRAYNVHAWAWLDAGHQPSIATANSLTVDDSTGPPTLAASSEAK